MCHLSLSQYGLVADIIGVLLLFRYGFPSKMESTEGEFMITESVSDERRRTIEKTNRNIRIIGYSGLVLIIVGFILQFIGSFG